MTLQLVKVILFMLFFVVDLCVVFTVNLSALQLRQKAALTIPNQKSPLTVFSSANSSTQPGESILIFGGTKALGQLVTKKLRQKDRYCLRVSSRVAGHAEAVIDDDAIAVFELDFVNGGELKMKQNLQAAVAGVSAVVIITGTAAFPKQNWIDDDIPHAIEAEAVEKLAQAAVQAGSVKKLVLMSSIGVERRKSFPFNALNIFGVLDATRRGEVV